MFMTSRTERHFVWQSARGRKIYRGFGQYRQATWFVNSMHEVRPSVQKL